MHKVFYLLLYVILYESSTIEDLTCVLGVCAAEANHERTPSDDGQKELISLDVWLNKPDIIHAYPCSEVKENGQNFPR
jgi:hypothetical protein